MLFPIFFYRDPDPLRPNQSPASGFESPFLISSVFASLSVDDATPSVIWLVDEQYETRPGRTANDKQPPKMQEILDKYPIWGLMGSVGPFFALNKETKIGWPKGSEELIGFILDE